MAQRKQNNRLINIFDLATIIIIIFIASLMATFIFYSPHSKGNLMLVTVKVTSDDKAIYKTAMNHRQIYLNSSNELLSVKEVNYKDESLIIVVQGRGAITENDTEFAGQRISIGQKTEIRGNYFAQGVITDIIYED